MAYTTIDDPTQYFNTVLWTGDIVDGDGTGHDQAVTGVGFQPNWIWHKCRSHANQHIIVDSVRGTGGSPTQMLMLTSQSSGAEASDNTNGTIESIDSDGYTVTSGNDSSSKSNNAGANGRTYVGWCWKAETAFSNDASATSIGTIDSSGSANQTAGISICSYTGNQTSGASIKHGLSTKPTTIWIKKRSATDHWTILTQTISLNTHLHLSQNNGAISDPMFTNTAPTTSVFTVDSDGQVNGNNDTFIAYCFSPIKGYSKFGKYTGNGNVDGPFIYTGFRPAWVMTKRTDAAGDWAMMDNKRPNEFNVVQNYLKGQAGDAEQTDDSFNIDICATGFKCRYNNGNYNADGGAYVYWAFAEVPTVNSNGAPANAR
tara:strand:+ start:185 stop:1300 length:1116 start_codon:yes stop_codon:yes gene_type:complete